MADEISTAGAAGAGPVRDADTSERPPPAPSLSRTATGAIATNISYQSLFAICLRTMESLGGKITESDEAAGVLEARWRYGVNLFGLRVRALFTGSAAGKTEVVFRGRFADAIDTSGAAARKAATVEAAFVAELERQSGVSAPAPAAPASSSRQKSKAAAAILALIVGGIGIHRFYLRTWGIGLVYLLFLAPFSIVSGFPLAIIISVADAVYFFAMRQTRFERRYSPNAVKPLTV